MPLEYQRWAKSSLVLSPSLTPNQRTLRRQSGRFLLFFQHLPCARKHGGFVWRSADSNTPTPLTDGVLLPFVTLAALGLSTVEFWGSSRGWTPPRARLFLRDWMCKHGRGGGGGGFCCTGTGNRSQGLAVS